MASETSSSGWLRQYGNAKNYQWHRAHIDGVDTFHRPLGFVEFSFHTDGRFFEGRADINNYLEVKIKNNLAKDAFRERILLAWACLRCRHSLLRARTSRDQFLKSDSFAPLGLHFLVDVLKDLQQVKDNARPHVVFLDDHFEHVDSQDFYYHCQNTARIIEPEASLSKLFVFPVYTVNGSTILRFLFVGGHEIWDGLTGVVWNRDFIQLLNDPIDVLHRKTLSAIDPERLAATLPLPQEALYPPIEGSIARQRWFWAIVRILRHVRRPLHPGIPNPFKRSGPTLPPSPLPPTFHPILPYTQLPVLTTQRFRATISPAATARLHRICREAGTSVGAGCFALVTLVGMEVHELRFPAGSSSSPSPPSRPDFIASFPLDARAFVADASAPEGMMLAFSDGIALPFLPPALGLEGRLRLLARRAHVQLGAYQKGRGARQAREARLTSRGAGLVLANQYLGSWEKVEAVEAGNVGVTSATSPSSPTTQGAYPVRRNATTYTHGVSSVGRRDAVLARGMYGLDDPEKDFAADFVDMAMGVRVREEEFLVGIGGFEDGIYVSASADMGVIDPVWAARWQALLENILEEPSEAEKSKL